MQQDPSERRLIGILTGDTSRLSQTRGQQRAESTGQRVKKVHRRDAERRQRSDVSGQLKESDFCLSVRTINKNLFYCGQYLE